MRVASFSPKKSAAAPSDAAFMGRGAWLLAGVAAVALASSSGCGGPAQRPLAAPPVRKPHSIVPAFESVSPRDAIVRVVGDVGCTGTLIADDQVLTARSCVAVHDGAGRPLARDQLPEQLSVELGGDFLPWGEVRVRANRRAGVRLRRG